MTMPTAAIDAIWSPMHLERLARTYWRFLVRCTLGLIRVEYTEDAALRRAAAPAVACCSRFKAPEYEMDAERGVVRWRIERGVLVAPPGTTPTATCEIDIRRTARRRARHASTSTSRSRSRTTTRAIALALSRWAYAVTQSRIHVIVTYGFLRSIAKLNLAPSQVGRFETPPARPAIDEVPDPQGPLPSERRRAPARPAARAARSAVARAGHRAQLLAVVPGVDAADRAGARAHDDRLGRRRAARPRSARPAARRRRSRRSPRRSSPRPRRGRPA